MALPPFQYVAPATVDETLALLSEYGERIKVLAGGTEITGRLKQRLVTPSHILSLKNVPGFSGIATKEGEVVIKAGTTLREVIASPLLKPAFSAIIQAAEAVAAPPIQNIATIGGNLLQNTRCLEYNQSELVRKASGLCFKTGGGTCLAVKGGNRCFSVYQGDLAPALMAFDATIKVEKKGSSRILTVCDLFSGKGESPHTLSADELVTEIHLPVPASSFASSYKKLRMRGSLDYPLASACVFLSVGDGVAREARIVLSACGPSPLSRTEAAGLLKGKALTQIDVQEVADAAARGVEAADNLVLPASYRRKMFRVLAARAIREALDDLTKAGS